VNKSCTTAFSGSEFSSCRDCSSVLDCKIGIRTNRYLTILISVLPLACFLMVTRSSLGFSVVQKMH